MARVLERAAREGGADVIAIGAASGGVGALRELVAGLPADLPAAVVIVLRSARDRRSCLPDLLERASRLPVEVAAAGARWRPGTIHVAPSGARLVLDRDGRFAVQPRAGRGAADGPIDAMLRSASRFGPRAIGVILSGSRDGGVMGLQAIAARGGLALVQDPRDADVPAMPCAALRRVDVEYVATAAALGPLLGRLCAPTPLAV